MKPEMQSPPALVPVDGRRHGRNYHFVARAAGSSPGQGTVGNLFGARAVA